MRKILSAALALLLVLSSFTGTVLFEHVHAEAAEAISYKDATLFELKTLTSADSETVKNFGKPVDGFELTDGWCDTIMCQYADSGTMAAFLAAIKNPGSKLVIEYEGEADISLVLQVYENYTWEGFSTGTVADVDGTVKSKTFDCKAMIAALEAKTYEQDGQTLNCKIDRLMNFNVGGKGNTLRSVKVVGDVGPYELVLDIDKRYVDNGETLADGYEITDWNPSIITGYMSNGFIDTFKEAIQKENAVIAVTYTAGESAQTLRLYMQQGPLEGGTSYPGAEYNEALNIALDNGKNLAIFSCAGLIEKYTSTTHGDDPTVTLSVDKLHNFAVGGTGNTIYGVQVLVPTASTEPDPVTDFEAFDLNLCIGGWTYDHTISIDHYGKYKIDLELDTPKTGYNWIILKCAESGTENAPLKKTSLNDGDSIKTTSFVVNGTPSTFKEGKDTTTVTAEKTVELQYYFSYNQGVQLLTEKPADPMNSITIEFEVIKGSATEDDPEPTPSDVEPVKVSDTVLVEGVTAKAFSLGDPVTFGDTITLIMSGTAADGVTLRGFLGSQNDGSSQATAESFASGRFEDITVEQTSVDKGVKQDDVKYFVFKAVGGGPLDVTFDSIYVYRCTKAEFEAWHKENPDFTTVVKHEVDPNVEPELVAKDVTVDGSELTVSLDPVVKEGETVTLIITGNAAADIRGYLGDGAGNGASTNTSIQFATKGEFEKARLEQTANKESNQLVIKGSHYVDNAWESLAGTTIDYIYIYRGSNVDCKAWLEAHPDFPESSEEAKCDHVGTERTYKVNEEDPTKHDVTCAKCGELIESVEHTYENGACTLCEYKHDHTGEELKYTDNEDGTHKVEYTVCKLVKEAEDCTYDATTGKCTKCGAAKPAEEEECDHVGTERTYQVNEKDATKHDVICAKCKTVIETVAHTYEDGVCTACEAKHDHTDEKITYVDKKDGTHSATYADCGLVETAKHTYKDGVCTLCESEHDHADEKITYVDKKDGTHTATYADCGLVETAKHTYKDGVCTLCESKHDHADEKVSYVDNKDGTHKATYADCGLTVEEKCTYDEKTGKCVCGAEKKVEVSTECKEEHKGWTIVDVSSYKDMDGNFYIDLPKTGKTGDLMSIHIIGTVTGTDAPRIFIANNGEWDNNFTGSYDHRLTVTDGVINYSADSFVLTAPKSGGDVASRIAFRDVKGLTITHLAYLFVDPTEEDPDAPTVPECTQDHEGWKIVDVTTYKNKSGEFNIPITGNVKAGDTLTVHIIGYATTAGRFYVANDEGSDHDLSGGRANVIDEKVKLDANGVFDYTTEPFTLYAPKNGSIVATRFIFKDSKALTITHFAYLVEHPESEPKGYEEDETLTNATVEAEDDSVVITPDGELKTEGLLVTFDGEGAPAAGKVTVTLAGGTTVKFDYEKVDALSVEKFAPDRVENGVITFNAVWGDCPGLWIGDNSTVTGYDSLQLKIDSVSDYSQFQIAYTDGSDNTVQGFANAGTYNIAIDPTKTIKQVFVQSSAAGGTVAISNILLRKAPVEEATKIEVSFKAGKKYVEVPTDKNKTITSVVVSYEGAEAADIASVKISSGKKTEDVSSKITLNGNAIRLGEDHHGFLYMGHIITLPHTFGDDNVCTICGYKRIVIEPTSKQIETEVKINDDTVNKLDKEVTVADGTATCSDDQFSILLPRAYSIGDEVKIHIKGSSDGDFRIWAADGGTTMSPEPLWKASENGFTSGNFDLEITLKIGDKDNSGKETANAVLFKGPAYGVKLNNFKLTYFAYYVEEEGDYKTSSDALYSLTTTGGQNFENKNLAGGLALETNDGRTRLATSWVGEGKVYDAMVNAFKANPEAVIKITYTGTITAFGIESENAGILDVANEVTEGQKYTVMTVKVADVLDTCKDAIADSSWRNIYVVAEDGAVLYGFEVVPA